MSTVKRAWVFLLLVIIALIGAWYLLSPKLTYSPPKTMLATAFKPSKPLTAFQVTDSNGKIFNEKSLRGHWTLLFFGYPGCPDICPATLGVMREVWQTYPQNKAPARFIFASIDPKQVDTATLRKFVTNYNSEFIGLSGSPEEMAQLSKQLGVYYKQQEGRIDHTSTIMLIDPQVRLSAVFTPPFTTQEISKDLQMLTRG